MVIFLQSDNCEIMLLVEFSFSILRNVLSETWELVSFFIFIRIEEAAL